MKKSQQNNIISPVYRILFILVAFLMIQFIAFFNSRNEIIEAEKELVNKEILELEKTIDKENAESKDLEKVDTSWRKTMENVEEIAREQLNLIKKDEIVLIPND